MKHLGFIKRNCWEFSLLIEKKKLPITTVHFRIITILLCCIKPKPALINLKTKCLKTIFIIL